MVSEREVKELRIQVKSIREAERVNKWEEEMIENELKAGRCCNNGFPVNWESSSKKATDHQRLLTFWRVENVQKSTQTVTWARDWTEDTGAVRLWCWPLQDCAAQISNLSTIVWYISFLFLLKLLPEQELCGYIMRTHLEVNEWMEEWMMARWMDGWWFSEWMILDVAARELNLSWVSERVSEWLNSCDSMWVELKLSEWMNGWVAEWLWSEWMADMTKSVNGRVNGMASYRGVNERVN